MLFRGHLAGEHIQRVKIRESIGRLEVKGLIALWWFVWRHRKIPLPFLQLVQMLYFIRALMKVIVGVPLSPPKLPAVYLLIQELQLSSLTRETSTRKTTIYLRAWMVAIPGAVLYCRTVSFLQLTRPPLRF